MRSDCSDSKLWTGDYGLMEAASFTDVRIDELPCFYAPAAPSGLFDMMRKSMVRATYVYKRQSEEGSIALNKRLKRKLPRH
jgi:hypothetical protein